jgi:hypothetical protein
MRVRLRRALCYLRAVSWCSAMTTKVCMNSNCRGYAHFVYTVAMRCVLCRCDLIAARSVEAAGTIVPTQPNVNPNINPNITSELSRKSARPQAAVGPR